MATPPLEMHHHRSRTSKITNEIREIIFGLGDGLVSTLGAITGIAGATYNSFFVILSGLVIISVEALSMGIGEYLSSKSEKEVWKKYMHEEKYEIAHDPAREHNELLAFYHEKGLTGEEAHTVANIVAKHPAWVLEEMAVHELKISPVPPESPVRGAVYMFIAYILGGLVPLSPYFFASARSSILPSVAITAFSLFLVGAIKAKFTTGKWVRGGLEMMLLSLTAAVIGYSVGQLVERYTS